MHAAKHGAVERVANVAVGDEIRVGDRDRMLRPVQAVQIFAPEVPFAALEAREHPHPAARALAERDEILWQREEPADGRGAVFRESLEDGAAPRLVEERAQLFRGVANDLDHVVAPALAAVFDRQPRPREVEAAGEAARAVDDEDLAVIALLDAREIERGAERRERMVVAKVAAGGDERVPERGRERERADGVVNHTHGHAAAARALAERLPKARADRVRADPIHLEDHLALRVRDRGEHRRQCLGAVAQEPHLVAADVEPRPERVGALPPRLHARLLRAGMRSASRLTSCRVLRRRWRFARRARCDHDHRVFDERLRGEGAHVFARDVRASLGWLSAPCRDDARARVEVGRGRRFLPREDGAIARAWLREPCPLRMRSTSRRACLHHGVVERRLRRDDAKDERGRARPTEDLR